MPVINPITKKDPPKLVVPKQKAGVPAETNPEKIAGYLREYAPVLEAAAAKYSVPRSLLVAVMITESGGRPDAQSPTGCKGVMQLSKSIYGANQYGQAVNPLDPVVAIDRAGAFLGDLNKKYKGDLNQVAVAYNQGEPYLNQAIKKAHTQDGHWQEYVGAAHVQEARYYQRTIGNILNLSDPRVNSEISGYLEGGAQMVQTNQISPPARVIQNLSFAQPV